MVSDWVIVGLTVVLVASTIWYAVTTHRALDIGGDANRLAREAVVAAEEALAEARSATEAALAGNVVTSRGFFGGELVVQKRGGGKFLVENVGNGQAHTIIADFEINDPPTSPPDWRPMSNAPTRLAAVAGRGQDASFFGTDVHHAELDVTAPENYRWPGSQDEQGLVVARLRLRYSDSFRGDLEAYSLPFGLVHDVPPNPLITPEQPTG